MLFLNFDKKPHEQQMARIICALQTWSAVRGVATLGPSTRGQLLCGTRQNSVTSWCDGTVAWKVEGSGKSMINQYIVLSCFIKHQSTIGVVTFVLVTNINQKSWGYGDINHTRMALYTSSLAKFYRPSGPTHWRVPSGKRWHNELERSTHFSWENPLSMIIFNSYFDITRGYIPYHSWIRAGVWRPILWSRLDVSPKTCQSVGDFPASHVGHEGEGYHVVFASLLAWSLTLFVIFGRITIH